MNLAISQKISLLNQAALQSLAEKNRSEILKKFTQSGLKILSGDFGFAWWKGKHNNFSLAYKSPSTPYEPTPPRKRGTNYWTQKNKVPLFVSTVQKNLKKRYDVSPYMKSYVIIPISYKSEVYGTIVICFKKKRIFSKEDRSLAHALGNSAAQTLTIQRLYQNMKDFRDRLDRTLDAVMIFDAETFKIEYANLGAVNILGYNQTELCKMNRLQLLPKNIQADFKVQINLLLKQKIKSLIFESQFHTKKGKVVPIEAFLQMVSLPDEPPKFLSISHDISKRKADELRIQELLKQKDEFLGIASHELRTPITTIKGFAQLLDKSPAMTDPKANYFISKINSQIEKLSRLVSDLLDVSKLESQKIIFERKKVDLNWIIREVVEDVQLSSPHHLISITGKISARVLGDHDRLTQVFTNILTNAVKYSPNGKKVAVELQRRANTAEITIQDFGMGISPKHQKQIFDKFFQTQNTSTVSSPGLGLGLFISREIILRHGGDVTVKSRKGHGSKFIVTLPILE
jgi:PAS domain S-box-containing protein